VCINVLDFNLLKDEEFYHNVYAIRNKENNRKLDKQEIFEIHFVEIPKMKVADKNDLLSFWVKFLNDPNDIEVLEMEKEKVEIDKTSLAQGMDINTVSTITGLSILEIEELKKNN